MQDTRTMMAEAKFYESYSRYDDSLGRYETWDEAVERVMAMHRQYYAGKMNEELEGYLQLAEDAYKNKLVLGSQRALQFGGEQLIRHQLRLYNCFHKSTRFVTSTGMKSFADFEDGDEVIVLTHKGLWKKAVVKSYGKQDLYDITFTNRGITKKVKATKNHRWLLNDGSETTSLNVGDKLIREPSILSDFSWDTASPEEQLYWCYGMVFGDGTKNNGYSLIRLCGHDVKYSYRFDAMGFKSSSSLSLKGDVIYYTGKYDKTLPDPNIDNQSLIRAFVRGYLDADGTKNSNRDGKEFIGIQSSNREAIDFIRNCFPIAGVHIRSEKELTGQVTNYGTRPYTVFFSTNDRADSKFNQFWNVTDITYSHNDEVWCLEVEDDHSFILEGGIVTGNCIATYADRPEFFGEYFYALLCGCGVGFSVQYQHINKLPKIAVRTKQPKTHVVEDSIEGWSAALDVLMSSYFQGGGKHPEYEGRKVYFDLSAIRPKGAKISGGFKAPGPDPLRLALDRIEYILQGRVLKEKEAVLKPIEVYDICMHASDAVLAGGVRRAATICVFSPEDREMMTSKTGNWFSENPQRARSNNSALILRDKITREKFSEMMESIKQFGEPGFVFADSPDFMVNPCVEIGFTPYLVDGNEKKSGLQGCNLTELNGSKCNDVQTFYDACVAASVLGTIQAGYTDFKFVTDITKKIFEKESLLGVSITGWMNNPEILFDESVLKEGARIVKKTNEIVAKLIGINPAARTTCTKPSGSASIILETASGIHPEHAPMYLRHVQMNKDTEIAQLIKSKNPYMVEESIWSANKSDYVVAFPIVSPPNSLFRDSIFGVKHLEMIKKAQMNWVEEGTNIDLCVDKTTRHNISNTITVDDWDEIEEYIFNNRQYFSGIALMSDAGDKSFFQAPNTEVLTADQIVDKYGTGALFASGLIVDSLKVYRSPYEAVDDYRFGPDLSDDSTNLGKKDWRRRFEKFANNYFSGDIIRAEHCLKDVYNLHKWEKIQQNFKPVDFRELKEKKFTDIDTMGAMACAGVSENGEVGCTI